tara:strand:- start:1232 stop:1663 length:432 start_codon:yes stop_codon:yes gene_type:complete
MGLDQYAYRRLPDEDSDGNITIVDWRKHNRLQGWMEQLWEDKGRPYEGNLDDLDPCEMGSDFNCVELEITLSDLEQLEAHVSNKTMPETGGFFFGDDSFGWENEDGKPYEGNNYFHKETDLGFIREAREAIADGQKVYYSSWW